MCVYIYNILFIYFYIYVCVCESFSHVQLLVTPWTIAHQAPLSMEFSRQEYWSGLPFPSPGDLLNPGIDPGLPYCRQILDCLNHQGSPFSDKVMKYMYIKIYIGIYIYPAKTAFNSNQHSWDLILLKSSSTSWENGWLQDWRKEFRGWTLNQKARK